MGGKGPNCALRYLGQALGEDQLGICEDLLSMEELPSAAIQLRGHSLELLDIGPHRACYRVEHSDPPLVIKVYAPLARLEGLRARLSTTRAAREARVLREAQQRGLPVPQAFGHARLASASPRRSALLMADLGRGSPLDQLSLTPQLAERAGAVLASAHAKGLRHEDLHLGNLFLSERGELFLLDLYKARFVAAPHRPSHRELLPLYLSLPWPEQASIRSALFGAIAAEASPPALADWLEQHLAKRLRRCKRSSGPFVVDGELHYRRDTLPAGGAAEWRERFREAQPHKLGRRGGVYRSQSGHWAKERDRRHAEALWEAAFALDLRGVCAPRALALVPTTPKRALVISEGLEHAQALDQAWATPDFDAPAASAALAQGYARLHSTGWRFRDGRGDNFMALPGGEIAFVDLDGAGAGHRPAEDLGRLFAWFQHQAPKRGDQAKCVRRFLRTYLMARKAHGRAVPRPRAFVKRILKRSERWRRRHQTADR